MPAQTDPNDDYTQERDLLAALGDQTLGTVVRRLLRKPESQKQLQIGTGLSQPQISRALKELRLLRLVSAPGSDGLHRILFREPVFAVLRSADVLAEVINARQTEVQKRASRQNAKDLLAGEAEPETAESA